MTSQEESNAVILAHLEHFKSDVHVLCKEMKEVKKELTNLKLSIKDTYIPRQSCIDTQKVCKAAMEKAVTKAEFSPVKKVVFFLVFLMLAAVAKGALQGVKLQ